jgi:hypothetical protein
MAVCYLVKAWMSIPKECIANCPGKKTGLLNLKNPINAEAIPQVVSEYQNLALEEQFGQLIKEMPGAQYISTMTELDLGESEEELMTVQPEFSADNEEGSY